MRIFSLLFNRKKRLSPEEGSALFRVVVNPIFDARIAAARQLKAFGLSEKEADAIDRILSAAESKAGEDALALFEIK